MWWYLIGSYFIWVITFQSIGFFIGTMYKTQVDYWYPFLYKSSLTPPGHVFSVVWPILYTLLAVAGCMLWRQKGYERTKTLFVLQMVLNWSWTTVFFKHHMLLLSWMVIATMVGLTVLIMVDMYKQLRIITVLLAPYLAWITFALYLNMFI